MKAPKTTQSRRRPPSGSLPQQVDGLHRGRAAGSRDRRARPRRDRDRRPPAPAGDAATRAQDHRPRAVRLPDEPARPQRDALLPDAHVRSGPLPADRLRPDDRRGVPQVRARVPRAARHVPLDSSARQDQGSPAELAAEGRAVHLRDRRRSHPRARRPRGQRHGHPHREAAALHRDGRRAAAVPAADVPRRGDEQ
jgi:hypothetical protein